jgi:hypothetical protein
MADQENRFRYPDASQLHLVFGERDRGRRRAAPAGSMRPVRRSAGRKASSRVGTQYPALWTPIANLPTEFELLTVGLRSVITLSGV